MAVIKNTCGLKKIMSKIFICIPAMNDVELLSTIERAYDYSNNPDNLSIGTVIFWKNDDIKKNNKPFFITIKNSLDKNFKKVRYDIEPWSFYPGVGQGRHAPTRFFNNEKYFLSIDSHTDFINNWDEELINLYEDSRKKFGKLRVITTYLEHYENKNISINSEIKDSKNTIRHKSLANRWPFFDFYKNLNASKINNEIMFPLPNDKLLSDEEINSFDQYFIDNQYLPAKKISAHCYFTESNPWLTEYNLNLHKDIKFWGEEFYQSCLSYARGYNLIWYKKQILFHHYGISGTRKHPEIYSESFKSIEEKNTLYQDYIKDSARNTYNKSSIEQDDNSIILNLLRMKENNFGYLPRSINGFLKYENINLINKKTSPWWKVPDLNVVYK